jgi:beta-glucosidase
VFPFGHGLSYTSFRYDDLVLSADELPVDGELAISFTLANVGSRAGTEVAQLYLRDDVGSVTRPVKELKGFARVSLDAGETARVTFGVHTDLLSFTGVDHERIVEPGTIAAMIGASSSDIRLTANATVTGDVRRVGNDRRLTSTVVVERPG